MHRGVHEDVRTKSSQAHWLKIVSEEEDTVQASNGYDH